MIYFDYFSQEDHPLVEQNYSLTWTQMSCDKSETGCIGFPELFPIGEGVSLDKAGLGEGVLGKDLIRCGV